MILLDTDVMIDLLRQYTKAILWLESLGDEEIILPGFVVMELIQGCTNKEEQSVIEKVISTYEILWPSQDSCDRALIVFALYHLSHDVGLLDTLIAQTAIERNLALYTFNRKHYAPIPGLNIVEPYSKK